MTTRAPMPLARGFSGIAGKGECGEARPEDLQAPGTLWKGVLSSEPLIGPLRRFWYSKTQRIIPATALVHHLRKRIHAQRLSLSTCKAGALPTELRPHVDDCRRALIAFYCAPRQTHFGPGCRTALEERLLCGPFRMWGCSGHTGTAILLERYVAFARRRPWQGTCPAKCRPWEPSSASSPTPCPRGGPCGQSGDRVGVAVSLTPCGAFKHRTARWLPSWSRSSGRFSDASSTMCSPSSRPPRGFPLSLPPTSVPP